MKLLVFFLAAYISALAASRRCSPDLPVSWVVEDSVGALALASATNCTGGVFDVEWMGYVELSETIYAIDGTVLNITGVGAGAVADGKAEIQFLNVVRATVHVSGLRIENCAAYYGGAIHANASIVTFNDTNFRGNYAGLGGALCISESTVAWSGETTFVGNTAVYGGGALHLNESIVSWSGETSFSNNTAGYFGGALLAEASTVSGGGQTRFSNNTAELFGGAVDVSASTVSWSGGTSFVGNTADHAGAVYVFESIVSWSGETSFSNNIAGLQGGALRVSAASTVSWDGEMSFVGNTAGDFAGALYVEASNASWSGETSFLNNAAVGDGGAMRVAISDVSWSGETSFSNNTSGWDEDARYASIDSSNDAVTGAGGALAVQVSTVSWSGDTSFFGNTAHGGTGGALYSFRSNVFWSGNTIFANNTANGVNVDTVLFGSGGALSVWNNSEVSWSGETRFSNNTADRQGGGLDIYLSEVSWSGQTSFSGNTAVLGGALYAWTNSRASWSGETMFADNTAVEDGGAVFVTDESSLNWTAGTTFLHNSCRGSGGALASVGVVDLKPGTSLFESNAAENAGGAAFISGTGVGPVFAQATFTSNTSPRGGAVYSASSGTTQDDLTRKVFPTTFKDCSFTDNRASTSGGAIESVAGDDMFVNTTFKGNTAGIGGALRLGGSASLINCTFIDNISDNDGGAAISNVGVSESSGSWFSGNVFNCEPGTYLDVVDGIRYEKVCDGCDLCDGCDVEDESLVPICVSQQEHTQSRGGDTTVEALEVDAGYWRATPTSLVILACYNEDACNGGLSGQPDFCQQGYEGPYCSVCSEGHTGTLSFTCIECVNSRGGIAIVIIVGIIVLFAGIALCMHLVSGEVDGARPGIIHRVIKRLPVQSIKIIVVVWQILTQFTSVANVTYPDVYQRFLDVVDVLNFDTLWIPSAGCLFDVDFHDRLVVSTIGPLVILALLAVTFTVAKRRNRGSEAALQNVRHRHVSMILLISFLVYSSVSATVFQTFACEDLDDDKEYLRVDYSIECDSSKHQAFKYFAGIMIFVYPVGIPLFYAYLLYKNRLVLKKKRERETSSQVQSISDLWVPYKPKRFYYEVVECLRRILLTGVVVFIYPNTAAQVAVTLIIAFLFAIMSERLSPYVSKWDASISLAGHIVVFMSMYVALLSKVDVSDERAGSQEVFAGILVGAHACMIVVVVVETLVIFLSMRQQMGPVYREGPRPRVHCKPSFS